ncbi:MAG: sugar transferase [Flavobacteriaceae bacterium]|nr:sugar transferase [Flavobacteriaceae bacterium]
MISNKQKITKRIFDIIIASIGIVICMIPIFVLVIIASFSTQSFGIYVQKRIGQFQKPFYLLKIRSMRINHDINTFTSLDDHRITKFGHFLRRYKLDELPQFFNVLIGNMSVVGPRPDVEAMLNYLTEAQKLIFQMKPGLVSSATLAYLNEDDLLSKEVDAKEYYLTTIWPQKVQLNLDYAQNWSLNLDFIIIIKCIRQITKSLFR